jgi:HPt (histidine-containing phosphotransfer) domain-containing protein
MTRESLSKTLASAPVLVSPVTPVSPDSDPRASFSRVLARQSAAGMAAHLAVGAIALGVLAAGRSSSTTLTLYVLATAAIGIPRFRAAHSFLRLYPVDPELWTKAYRAGALFSSLGITLGTAFVVATVGFDSAPWLVFAALAGLAAAGVALVMTDLAVFALLELSDKLLLVAPRAAAPTANAVSSAKRHARAHPADVIPPFASEVISVRRAGKRVVVDFAPVEEADLIEDELPDSSDTPLYSELAGDADLDGILAEFLETLGARAAALQTALAESDLPNLRRLAHQLKGAAGSYGFPTITEQAKTVEAALATNDPAKISRTVATLCTLCLRASNSGATLTAGAA